MSRENGLNKSEEMELRVAKLESALEQANERIKEFICIERNLNVEIDMANKDIQVLAENISCAGEVIKRSNPALGDGYKELANKYKDK